MGTDNHTTPPFAIGSPTSNSSEVAGSNPAGLISFDSRAISVALLLITSSMKKRYRLPFFTSKIVLIAEGMTMPSLFPTCVTVASKGLMVFMYKPLS